MLRMDKAYLMKTIQITYHNSKEKPQNRQILIHISALNSF